MIDAHRRRMDRLNREDQFFKDNVADLGAAPFLPITTAIRAKMALILTQDAKLTSTDDDKDQKYELKGDARDALLVQLRTICLAAKAIGNAAVPGITTMFQMPEPRTDQNIIAKATAMFNETLPLQANFVSAGLANDFRTLLTDARDAFQTRTGQADSATEGHGDAVGSIADLFRQTMELSRQRSALVKIKYMNNPGKLAAWAIASHLDKAPQKPAPTPPTP